MSIKLDPEVEEARMEFYRQMAQQAARVSDHLADHYARVCASMSGLPAADQIFLLQHELDEMGTIEF